MEITLRVGPADAGQRIDVFLNNMVPVLSRSKAAELLRGGAILVNGAPCKPSYRLRGTEAVAGELLPPVPSSVEPQNIPLAIVYEDEDVAVVNKPAGLVVHPAGNVRRGTMVNALLYHLNSLSSLGGAWRPGLVHRLDKDTSGLLVVAKNDHVHYRLGLQVASRAVERIYVAFLWGSPPAPSGTIDKPLARSRRDRRRFVVDSRGKKAVTHYRRIEELTLVAKVEVTLETGRTHQIRVHMSHIGHPVVGDPTYGGRQRSVGRLTGSQKAAGRALLRAIGRQALHAQRLTFTHPRTQEQLSFDAPVPEDMVRLEQLLRGMRCD
jgi:23S rRNA pseudouridine1911/1915/1917 synthase